MSDRGLSAFIRDIYAPGVSISTLRMVEAACSEFDIEPEQVREELIGICVEEGVDDVCRIHLMDAAERCVERIRDAFPAHPKRAEADRWLRRARQQETG